jgi:hypothetical protein
VKIRKNGPINSLKNIHRSKSMDFGTFSSETIGKVPTYSFSFIYELKFTRLRPQASKGQRKRKTNATRDYSANFEGGFFFDDFAMCIIKKNSSMKATCHC